MVDKVFASAAPPSGTRKPDAAFMLFALVLLWWRLSRACLKDEDPWCSEPTSNFLSRPGQPISDLFVCSCVRHGPRVDAVIQIKGLVHTERSAVNALRTGVRVFSAKLSLSHKKGLRPAQDQTACLDSG